MDLEPQSLGMTGGADFVVEISAPRNARSDTAVSPTAAARRPRSSRMRGDSERPSIEMTSSSARSSAGLDRRAHELLKSEQAADMNRDTPADFAETIERSAGSNPPTSGLGRCISRARNWVRRRLVWGFSCQAVVFGFCCQFFVRRCVQVRLACSAGDSPAGVKVRAP